MKMTKKWLAAVGAAVMAVSVLLAPGANVAKASSVSALVVDAKIGDVSAKVGDEISIPITVSSESALRGFNGKLNGNYDTSVLEYKGVECSVSGMDSSAGGNFGYMVGSSSAFKSAEISLKFKVLKCSAAPVTVKAEAVQFSDGASMSEAKDLVSTITIAHADLKETITVPATCTEAGTKTVACGTCGYSTNEEIPATGHTAGDWKTVKASTCTEKGSAELHCKTCDAVMDTKELPLADHTWKTGDDTDQDGWKVIEKATEEKEGSKERECEICRKKETAVIAKLTPETTKADETTKAKETTKANGTTKANETAKANGTTAANGSVSTGDTSMIWFYVVLIVIAGGALAAVLVRRKNSAK